MGFLDVPLSFRILESRSSLRFRGNSGNESFCWGRSHSLYHGEMLGDYCRNADVLKTALHHEARRFSW